MNYVICESYYVKICETGSKIRFEQIMDLPSVLLPEVRFNTNHVSIIFRAPYWLLGTVFTVCVIRCLQVRNDIDLFLITTIATAVFWILDRSFVEKKPRTAAELNALLKREEQLLKSAAAAQVWLDTRRAKRD